jgi:hypothetical protein
MSIPIVGNPSHLATDLSGFTPLQYSYRKLGLPNLAPSSDIHRKLLNHINERAWISAEHISQRHPSWQEVDRIVTCYLDADDAEILRSKKANAVDFDAVNIVFPYSYAILETLMSYFVGAFFQDPVFRYEGHGPEDVIGAILLEKVVQMHVHKFKVLLNLHTMARDAFTYGIGVVSPFWKTITRRRRARGAMSNLRSFFGRGDSLGEEVAFAGNALENVDPYSYLPDPYVGIDKPQEGNHVGWLARKSYNEMLLREANKEVFNVGYLKYLTHSRQSVLRGDSSIRNRRSGVEFNSSTLETDGVDVLIWQETLIPKEWNLGSKEVPEKWLFEVAADSVIVRAEPLDFDHGDYLACVAAPDFDGYSGAPLSRIEILSGMQNTLDFMFNSHIKNVRKAVNDMIVYDPQWINTSDLRDPKAGKLIRTRRPMWGKGVKDAIQQLAITDVTKQHVADSSWIAQWMQKVAGTDDSMMGALRQSGPERLTSDEFKGTKLGAYSRMERIARVIGLQAMQDVGEMFAAHTQEFQDEETYVKIAGDWQEVLLAHFGADAIDRGRIPIRPESLLINYDTITRDGSIPGSNFSRDWFEFYKIVVGDEQLRQEFDTVRMFEYIATQMGAKNVHQFRRLTGAVQPQIQDNEEVLQQADRGNIVPLSEVVNG